MSQNRPQNDLPLEALSRGILREGDISISKSVKTFLNSGLIFFVSRCFCPMIGCPYPNPIQRTDLVLDTDLLKFIRKKQTQ